MKFTYSDFFLLTPKMFISGDSKASILYYSDWIIDIFQGVVPVRSVSHCSKKPSPFQPTSFVTIAIKMSNSSQNLCSQNWHSIFYYLNKNISNYLYFIVLLFIFIINLGIVNLDVLKIFKFEWGVFELFNTHSVKSIQ